MSVRGFLRKWLNWEWWRKVSGKFTFALTNGGWAVFGCFWNECCVFVYRFTWLTSCHWTSFIFLLIFLRPVSYFCFLESLIRSIISFSLFKHTHQNLTQYLVILVFRHYHNNKQETEMKEKYFYNVLFWNAPLSICKYIPVTYLNYKSYVAINRDFRD